MNASFLQKIGLQVEDEEGTTASFEPASALINPVSRQMISKVTFTVVGDRLIAIDPSSLVGSPPIALTRVERAADLEEQLSAALNETILLVQRRSADLTSLGITSRVDPETLTLTADIESPPYKFLLQSDKRGTMRLMSATKDGAAANVPEAAGFDVSEFRERAALITYLRALLGDTPAAEVMEVSIEDSPPAAAPAPETPSPAPEPVLTIGFGELADAFGRGAQLPATTPLEILVEMKVGEEKLRFAAARIAGRTFRGLLAGSKGKIWAGRFEIDEFPGVLALVAEHMKVPMDEVRVVGPNGEEAS